MISFRDRFHTVDVLLVDDIAREREEKEVVVLAITRVELIDSRKVFEIVLPLRRLFPSTRVSHVSHFTAPSKKLSDCCAAS